MKKAILLTNGLFDTENAKTAHGLIRESNRFKIVGLVDHNQAGKDAVLMAGLGPFKMVNAAEILRYTTSGWKESDIKQTEKHFKKS